MPRLVGRSWRGILFRQRGDVLRWEMPYLVRPPGKSHEQSNQPYDDDLPAEIDFSQGKRGQFYQPQTRLNLPVYLEAEVEAYLAARTEAKGVDVSQLVHELLKKDIELIETAR